MSSHLSFFSRRSVRGFTLIEFLIALIVVAVLIALLLPATRRTREPGRRTQCKNHLKQIGLALHIYHDVYKCFPPAYTVDRYGQPLHSWRTLILPYLDQKPLYDQIDLTVPWDDPANEVAFQTPVPAYRCPSDGNSPAEHTNYLAVVTAGSAFGTPGSHSISEITDGVSSTLLVIEVSADHAVPWYAPQDADEIVLQSLGAKSKSTHDGGQHGLMADGSVRFLSNDIAAETFQALITAAAGDKVGEY